VVRQPKRLLHQSLDAEIPGGAVEARHLPVMQHRPLVGVVLTRRQPLAQGCFRRALLAEEAHSVLLAYAPSPPARRVPNQSRNRRARYSHEYTGGLARRLPIAGCVTAIRHTRFV